MKSVTENRLRIFDFDDTLAETGEKVKLSAVKEFSFAGMSAKG